MVDSRLQLTELYAEHWRALLGYAGRRCGNAADAADVVSETFLICWRRLADVPAGSDARLWLFGTARRVIANQNRADRRRERLGAALLAALTLVGTQADQWFVRSESEIALHRALAQLPAVDQELFCLVGWEELTPAEAAIVLGISAVAARARLSRARRKLRGLLEDPSPQAGSLGAGLSGTDAERSATCPNLA